MNRLRCAVTLLFIIFSTIISTQSAPIDPKIFAQGGSGPTGTNVFIKGQVPVWESDNGRNVLQATGSYGQHFGPTGNSPPQLGGGFLFSHFF